MVKPLLISLLPFEGFQIHDLKSTTTGFDEELLHWTISSPQPSPSLTTCFVGTYFFGTLNLFTTGGSYVERQYINLPSHNEISYTIWFSILGQWSVGDGFSIIFSSQTGSQTYLFSNTLSTFYNDLVVINCGSFAKGVSDLLFMGRLSHSGPTLGIRIVSNILPASTNCYFTFRDVSILLRNSTSSLASMQNYVASIYFYSHSYPMNDKWPCSPTQYNDPTFGCLSCHGYCRSCFGGTAGDCFSCQSGYYFDGANCITCHTSCETCSGQSDRSCITCPVGKYLLDNMCIPTCDPPFLSSTLSSNCFYPCEQNEFLYPDKLCYSTCDSRFTITTQYDKKLCIFPCPAGQIRYYNSTCSATTCPYPLKMKKYGGFQICEYPCNSTEIVYPDQTCAATCVFPFVVRTYGLFQACESPCSPVSYYSYYWENTCRNTCPSPLQQRVVHGINVCDPPQCGAKFCDLCQAGVCPEFYYCNQTQPSGQFCFAYSIYKLDPKYVRTVPNGLVLSADVVPNRGIVPGVNDTLLFSLQGLFAGLDYNSRIEKIDKASFYIYIDLLRAVNTSASLVGEFYYGPSTLGIRQTMKLPRVTYISSQTEETAKKGKIGSQILFLVFLVAIISCILGGGISIIWSALPETQYGFYLRYLNIPYLRHTEIYFESLSSYDMLVADSGGSETLSPVYRNSLPTKFFIQNYSPNFIDNGGQVIIQFLIVIAVVIFCMFIVKYIKFSGRGILVLKLLDFLTKTFKWNGVLRYTMTFTLALSTASFIQIYNAIFGQKVYFPSLVLSIACLIAIISNFQIMLTLLGSIPKSRYEKIVYSKRFGTLWEDLDPGSIGKYFYWLVTLRGFLLGYLCVFFGIYPYVQIVVLIIYQAVIVGLFIKGCKLRRVFADNILNKVTMCQELCLLLEKMFIFVFLVLNKSVTDNTLILLGWLIVIPAIAMQIIQTLYSFCSQMVKRKVLFLLLKDYLLKRGQKREKKIRRKNMPRPVNDNEPLEMIIEEEVM